MRYVYRNGEIVPADTAGPRNVGRAAPYVISDNMEPLKHHGTGRVIDSKAKFRAETRAIGAVEIGNEPIKPRQPIKLDNRQRRDDIKRAIYNLRSGIK